MDALSEKLTSLCKSYIEVNDEKTRNELANFIFKNRFELYNDANINAKITEFLNEKKINPKLSGYDYIMESLRLLLKHPGIKLVNGVYVKVGRKFNVSSMSAGRNMRYAIESAYKNNVPSNSEFFSNAIAELEKIL